MNVFRKVSLDRLSSPEQLDQLMQVTDARGWIMLSAFGTILAIAVLWGFLGSVEHNVPCSGMLVKSGGVFEVSALSSGRITDLAVRAGDMVTEGQVVARMSQPELADKLLEARAVATELRTQHEEIVAHGSKDVALQTRLLAQQRETVSQTIAAAQRSAKSYRETGELQAKLVAKACSPGRPSWRPATSSTRRSSRSGTVRASWRRSRCTSRSCARGTRRRSPPAGPRSPRRSASSPGWSAR
jgi:HlyD family secretion protein